jgi:chemotaxis response regulator CheB
MATGKERAKRTRKTKPGPGGKQESEVEQPERGAVVFPVVGIGASAGGLEALSELFANMPSDTGAAFVIVQHLAPSKDSAMPELVARYTRMPVHEVTDNLEIKPDTIYLIPPGKNMSITDGTLQLLNQVGGGNHLIPEMPELYAQDSNDSLLIIDNENALRFVHRR